jgi:hypothetical protein
MESEAITYDKAELRSIIRAFKAMDDEAISQAKESSSALADFVRGKIVAASASSSNKVAPKIAQGSKVSKSSKIGEISFGFASQRLSGGGTTQQLWGGYEFGSNKYKQFPVWSGKEGRGTRGWFIYPTLRSAQPEIIAKWEESFSQIVRKYD